MASDGDTRVTTGVEYAARLGFRPLLLDLHLPPGDGPFPVVVFVHGGGWRVGRPPDTRSPAALDWSRCWSRCAAKSLHWWTKELPPLRRAAAAVEADLGTTH